MYAVHNHGIGAPPRRGTSQHPRNLRHREEKKAGEKGRRKQRKRLPCRNRAGTLSAKFPRPARGRSNNEESGRSIRSHEPPLPLTSLTSRHTGTSGERPHTAVSRRLLSTRERQAFTEALCLSEAH